MGNDLKTNNQILLLGPQGHGKTLFLYTNSLKNPRENATNVFEPSVSYNYEVLVFREESFGIWDLPGSPFFQKLWKHFYRNIAVTGIIYMVLVKSEEADLQDADNDENTEKMDAFLEARKNIHVVVNEPELRNAFVLVVFNETNTGSVEMDDRQKRKQEYEKKIKFSRIQNELKDSVVLNAAHFNEFEEFIEKLTTLSETAKKLAKNKDKDKEKEKEKSTNEPDKEK